MGTPGVKGFPSRGFFLTWRVRAGTLERMAHIVRIDNETWARLTELAARRTLESGERWTATRVAREAVGAVAQAECGDEPIPEPEHGVSVGRDLGTKPLEARGEVKSLPAPSASPISGAYKPKVQETSTLTLQELRQRIAAGERGSGIEE